MNEDSRAFAENLIRDAVDAASALKRCLREEAEALKTARDPAVLTSLAAVKKLRVAELEALNSALGDLLAAENLPSTPSGVTVYLARLQPAADALAENWRVLCALCRENKFLNEQNGAAIELLHRHARQAVQVLKSQSQLASTYGPDGACRNQAFVRSRVKA